MLNGRHGNNLSEGEVKMYHFNYVPSKQLSPIKKDLISIMNSVQNFVCHDFTFQFEFVGSIQQEMVTQDIKSNIGFDFDVDIQVNDKGIFSAKEIKNKIRTALDKVAPDFGYSHAEDSTRVLTIKMKDRINARILHSCDFAVVKCYTDASGRECQKYIRFHKKQKTYAWEEQAKGYYLLSEKSQWMKDHGYWNEMRKLYLEKKNNNNNPHKHSRSIYAETVHEICQKYRITKGIK